MCFVFFLQRKLAIIAINYCYNHKRKLQDSHKNQHLLSNQCNLTRGSFMLASLITFANVFKKLTWKQTKHGFLWNLVRKMCLILQNQLSQKAKCYILYRTKMLCWTLKERQMILIGTILKQNQLCMARCDIINPHDYKSIFQHYLHFKHD